MGLRFFPESAPTQLEFDKIRGILSGYARSPRGKSKVDALVVQTDLEWIRRSLHQSHEYKALIQNGLFFPNDFTLALDEELKLIGIPGAVLRDKQILHFRLLASTMLDVIRWFDVERKTTYPQLASILRDTRFEKAILEYIDEIFDESGLVKDKASPSLGRIRSELSAKRSELRRTFDRAASKLQRAGQLADIEESFINGRRVVAIFAEFKRQVRGILHGESDTRRTAFIEPEETIELNNEVFSLEHEEKMEIQRILRHLCQKLQPFAGVLNQYYEHLGEYDFISAKAKLALDMKANMPSVDNRAQIRLMQAVHPLLYLYNQKGGKETIPTDLFLDDANRILVISGPNAGGKTVTMKTVGLCQLMAQSGLLIPAHPDSQLGAFRQVMIHIGDTQSIEFELSTYSSHLKNLKVMMENANGKTLFFIDELGSGSDPNLGGAFAEAILEEMLRKHAMGIVTTHYLNLKVMANNTKGIVNGAMSFDEKNLQPLYRLSVGKPGSSYTFAIAEKIGLDRRIIERARQLVDVNQFKLDKLLHRTEQDSAALAIKIRELNQLMEQNKRLKSEMSLVLDREKHKQQIEVLKQQNRIKEDRIQYLKDLEQKIKQLILDWKRSEDKNKAIRQMQALLFQKSTNQVNAKTKAKADQKYAEIGGTVEPGKLVKLIKNHQVGVVKEIRGKKAIVQIGQLPITIGVQDLIIVEERKTNPEATKQG